MSANYIDIAYGAIVFPLDQEPTLFASLYSFLPQAAAQSDIQDVRWGAGVNHQALVERIKEGGLETGTVVLLTVCPTILALLTRCPA